MDKKRTRRKPYCISWCDSRQSILKDCWHMCLWDARFHYVRPWNIWSIYSQLVEDVNVCVVSSLIQVKRSPSQWEANRRARMRCGHTKVWECILTYSSLIYQGQHLDRQALIEDDVEEPSPSFEENPRDFVTIIGQSIDLQCKVHNRRNFTVRYHVW